MYGTVRCIVAMLVLDSLETKIDCTIVEPLYRTAWLLSHPQLPRVVSDLQVFLETIKFARKVSQTKPLSPFLVGPHDPPGNVTSDADFLA